MQQLPDYPEPAPATVNENGIYQVNPGFAVGHKLNMTLYDVLNWGYDLGMDTYPIWNEERRKPLNDTIVNHFMFREVAGETPYMFVWFLNRTLIEEMPPLNPLFELAEQADASSLRESEHFDGTTRNDSNSETDSTNQVYNSLNPKETMVGKDPTLYYDTGQFQTGHGTLGQGSTTHHVYTRSGAPISSVMSQWAITSNNPLKTLLTLLEPCFRQIVRPNVNQW